MQRGKKADSSPGMDSALRARMYEKVQSMQIRYFPHPNVLNIWFKRGGLFFNSLNLHPMKKNLTPVFGIVSLIIFSVYLAGSLHSGNVRALDVLIAKAHAAGAQEATQGRYFHQKTKTTTFPNSAASISIEPIRIDESWYDTQSAFSMDFQRDEATGKIIKGVVTTADKIFELNDAVVYETRRDAKHVGTSRAPFDVNKIIGQGFKDYLNDPDHKSLNVLFPQLRECR